MPEQVHVVDTTLRDGQLSLWATRMRTGMMLPALDRLDNSGFDAIEVIGSVHFKVCVRELRENPWERIRLLRRRARRTPLRSIQTRYITSFQTTPPSVQRLWMERLAANGIRQVRMSDPSNTVSNLAQEARLAQSAGLETILNLIYSVSPKHTDEYYAERARALGGVGALNLCLKDPGGLLTPERTRTLVRTLVDSSGGRPVEIHTHCNTGLGPVCCLEALHQGARIVDTAVPPLANGTSLPSVFKFMENAAALGYEVPLDRDELCAVERHFRRISERDSLPQGVPAEYEEQHFRRQVPGGMVSNFRNQLSVLGMENRLPEVLDEIVQVRAELGYPIMVTPYAQFVGTQAFINVVSGERYREVTDEIIRYALGHWGRDEAEGLDPDVRDRILGRSRAAEVAAQTPEDVSIPALRRQLGAGPTVDDDELLLRYLVGGRDVEAMRGGGPIVPDTGECPPLLSLLRGLCDSRRFASVHVSKGGTRMMIVKPPVG